MTILQCLFQRAEKMRILGWFLAKRCRKVPHSDRYWGDLPTKVSKAFERKIVNKCSETDKLRETPSTTEQMRRSGRIHVSGAVAALSSSTKRNSSHFSKSTQHFFIFQMKLTFYSRLLWLRCSGCPFRAFSSISLNYWDVPLILVGGVLFLSMSSTNALLLRKTWID